MSEYVTDAVLATDDDEIAEIGREYGAQVIKRPVMRDDITANVVFTMVGKELLSRGWDMETFVHVLPTSPTRRPDDIDNMIRLYKMGNGTSIFPFVSRKETLIYEKCHEIINTFQYRLFDNTGSYYEMALGMGCHNLRRYIDFHFHDNRFTFETDSLEDHAKHSTGFTYMAIPMIVEPWQFYDIDNYDEFELCEWYFKKKGLFDVYNEWWEATGRRQGDADREGRADTEIQGLQQSQRRQAGD